MMDFLRDILDKISDLLGIGSRYELSEFQKKKLLHEFKMFYGTLLTNNNNSNVVVFTLNLY